MKLKKILLPLSMLFLSGSLLQAQTNLRIPVEGTPINQSFKAPNDGLTFIQNKGQWNDTIKYKAILNEGALFLTKQGFVYNYVDLRDLDRAHDLMEQQHPKTDYGDVPVHQYAYKVNFVGSNNSDQFEPAGKQAHYQNYIVGNDASKWAGHVALFKQVLQKNIYSGIDVNVFGNGYAPEYDFIVAPNADPGQIKLAFEGIQPRLTAKGDLSIKTPFNEILESAPIAYQMINGEKVNVAVKYRLQGKTISFELPEGYDKSYELVIDPTLVFCTYSGAPTNGGIGYYSYATTYGNDGTAFPGGSAWNAGWPTTTGAFQTNFGGSQDICINKYSSNGANLIFSTYIGGSGEDHPHALRVNGQNELYVVGWTRSTNFPTTTGAFSTTLSGTSDIFVSHLSLDGSQLLGGTYVGGSSDEATAFSLTGTSSNAAQNTTSPVELTFDNQNNVWVVSNTNSTNFPVSANAQQATSGGATDGVIFELDPTCSNLIYSSYLGGNSTDALYSIQTNSQGQLVVGGFTQSSNFPTSPNAYHSTSMGGRDGVVAVINPANGGVLASTFLGTSGTDVVVQVQVDHFDSIYVMGVTNSNYPIVNAPYNLPNGNVFIDVLDPDLTMSARSTRVGGSSYFPDGFLLDYCGNVYVAGLAAPAGLPTTPDAILSNGGTTAPFWFCTLEANFTSLMFASYLGAQNDHTHCGVNRMDPNGIVYHSICNSTHGSVYPFVTPGVWGPQIAPGSGQDIVTLKFAFDIVTPITMATENGFGANVDSPHTVRGCNPAYFDFIRGAADSSQLTLHYIIGGTGVNGVDYQQIPDSITIPANATSASLPIYGLIVPNMPTGVKTVILSILAPCGPANVIATDTVYIFDSLYAKILTPPTPSCPGDTFELKAATDTDLTYTWAPLGKIIDQSPLGLTVHTAPTTTTNYTFKVTQPGANPQTCSRTVSYKAVVDTPPVITMPARDTTVCLVDSIALDIKVSPENVAYDIQWSPATYLRDDTSAHNRFYAAPGAYHYRVIARSKQSHCADTAGIGIRVVPPVSINTVRPRDTTIDFGESVQIHVDGKDIIYWAWSPTGGLDDPSINDPIATPQKSTVYQVIGISKYGCRDTADVNINVAYNPHIQMPNAFTPNGDGLNDYFTIPNIKFEKIVSFKVFDRLGQLVYNNDEPKKGWDGTFKGKAMGMDNYFYQIQLALPNGQLQNFKGSVLLIR